MILDQPLVVVAHQEVLDCRSRSEATSGPPTAGIDFAKISAANAKPECQKGTRVHPRSALNGRAPKPGKFTRKPLSWVHGKVADSPRIVFPPAPWRPRAGHCLDSISRSNPTAFQAVSFELNSTRMEGWRNTGIARTRPSISSTT